MIWNNKELRRHLLSLLAVGGIGTAAAWLFDWRAGAACLCTVVALVLLQLFFTLNRYRRISTLSDYLRRVAGGDDTMELPEYREGELSMLKTNLYKTAARLRFQAEEMKKEKIYLADALADISHQLKTPITSMMVMSDLLKDTRLEPERQREFLNNIDRQLEKTQWIIQNLLKLSKIDAGQIQLKMEPLSLDEVVQAAAAPFQIMAEVKGQRLLVQNDSGACITGDRNWTVEAVGNLIKNCIEHTPAGGTVQVVCRHNPLYSALTVADNGVGIAEEELPHIFERFYKGKNSAPDSVGIGLALSKTIFNRENAVIDVTSELQKGTTFEIRFYKQVV